MRKLDVFVFSFLLLAVFWWFSGFYFANTSFGKIVFLGLPLWSYICTVFPALLAIFVAFVAVKASNLKSID